MIIHFISRAIGKGIDTLMSGQEKGGEQKIDSRPLFLSTLQQWSLPCMHLFWGNRICGIGKHPASSCFGLLYSVDNYYGTIAYSM